MTKKEKEINIRIMCVVIGMFLGAIVAGILLYIEPDRLPPTKENCIQLFNSLN